MSMHVAMSIATCRKLTNWRRELRIIIIWRSLDLTLITTMATPPCYTWERNNHPEMNIPKISCLLKFEFFVRRSNGFCNCKAGLHLTYNVSLKFYFFLLPFPFLIVEIEAIFSYRPELNLHIFINNIDDIIKDGNTTVFLTYFCFFSP